MIPAMSRKPKKGYYVKGQFVAEGSELDLALKLELRGDRETSRTTLKKESEAAQALGESLLKLRANLLNGLNLPENLLKAINDAARITDFEGRRRQMQYVGKLMRRLEPETLQAAQAALDFQHQGSPEQTQILHEIEEWRDALIADDASLQRWLTLHPSTDSQAMRALIRQARKDAQANLLAQQEAAKTGQIPALKTSRAHKEIFQTVRSFIQPETTEEE